MRHVLKFPKHGDVAYGLAGPAAAFADNYDLDTLKKRSTERVVSKIASILDHDDYVDDWVDVMKDDPRYGGVFRTGATFTHHGFPTPWARWKVKTKAFMEYATRHTEGLVMHFVLADIDMVRVATKSAPNDLPRGRAGRGFADPAHRRSITGVELRWLYRNWADPRVPAHVQFWDGRVDWGTRRLPADPDEVWEGGTTYFWPCQAPWDESRWADAWRLYDPRRRW